MSNHTNYPESYSFKGIPKGDYPLPIIGVASPTSSTKGNYQLGQIWINKAANTVYMLVDVENNAALWSVIAGSGSGIGTLTFGSGGAIAPVMGNISLLGTSNQIVTAGTPGTGTWSLSPTLVAPGSITATTTITATLGDITASDGDIVSTLGQIRGVSLFAAGDEGTGVASQTAVTNVVDTTQDAGDLTIVSTTAASGTNAGFVKIYVGTQVAWVPYFTDIAPT